MHFCEQCGSASRDKDGFCGGCGAAWPSSDPLTPAAPKHAVPAAKHAPAPISPLESLPAKISTLGLVEVGPKNVKLAVLLAIFLGPAGLAYSTATGAYVMAVVTAILFLWLGGFSFPAVLPFCAFWAWRAARESASVFD